MTRAEAHQVAVAYMRRKLYAGATRRSMNETVHEGFGGPGEWGFEIAHGRMTVPGVTRRREHGKHRFTTDALVDDVEREQGELFGAQA